MTKSATPSPLEELKALKMSDDKKRWPQIPDHARPRPVYKVATANGLTKAIISWLTLNGCYAVRVSTQGQWRVDKNHIRGGQWTNGSTRKGTADIHASIRGKHVSIEVKVGKDRMSPEQIATMEDVNRSGGLYFIARDFDSFKKWYDEQMGKK